MFVGGWYRLFWRGAFAEEEADGKVVGGFRRYGVLGREMCDCCKGMKFADRGA